ncbi:MULTISPECIES: hypothetical protein [unclassified Ruegeria]|uniref:hypothetical protein n=1 Tax=unclassified Ruegeria TaxID=2625375 RepID=UPI001489C4CC|nr:MULTISPECIES: hypothetical protein [unclassified Ruegeria]
MSETIPIPTEWTIESAARALKHEDDAAEDMSTDARAIAAVVAPTFDPSTSDIDGARDAAFQAVERLMVLAELHDMDFARKRALKVGFCHLVNCATEEQFRDYEQGAFAALCEGFGVTLEQVRGVGDDE